MRNGFFDIRIAWAKIYLNKKTKKIKNLKKAENSSRVGLEVFLVIFGFFRIILNLL